MKRVILTGANGLIGSTLVAQLLAQGVEVVAVVRNGRRERLFDHRLLRIISCDMAQINMLIPEVAGGADIFFHFAWEGFYDAKREDVETQLKNVNYALDALRVAAALKCRRFVGAGSLREREAVFSLHQAENRPGPGYLYGGAKAAVYLFCRALAAQLDVEMVWGILTNTYGVGDASPFIINSTIRKILNNQPLSFTAATQNIDFIYSTDAARAFYLLAERGLPDRCYTVGSGDVRPLREYLLEIKHAIAPEREFTFGSVPFSGINLPEAYFDCSKLKADTGFMPEVPFREGIYKTAEWLKGEQKTE